MMAATGTGLDVQQGEQRRYPSIAKLHTWDEILHRQRDGQRRHQDLVRSGVENGADDGLHLEPTSEVSIDLGRENAKEASSSITSTNQADKESRPDQ